VGAAANGVVEKESNLEMARRVQALLVADGYEVLLTRESDAPAAAQIPGYTAARSDIQARINLANESGAAVFVSIHSNGSTDPAQKGVEVWYDSARLFAADNLSLAQLLLDNVVAELRRYGYPAENRGLFDGACFRLRQGRCFTLFVLGGARETSREEIERRGGDPEALGFNGAASIYSQPATMPGALVELLLTSNAADAAVLRDNNGRQAMARGIAAAIEAFLASKAGG
jgi:N-acetylmuramoyl-L-alanine amidase